jgi:glucose-6-phosphate 1-dehydrogenase
LIAMEAPISLKASDIHNEKVKVVQSMRPIGDIDKYVVRGQYGKGYINGIEVVGYRSEKNVSPTSDVETYVAMELFIDNWRWAGVPFYLRAGKRLPKRTTEIAVTFRRPPGYLLQIKDKKVEPNVLVIRIQPDEGISLKINCKVPGTGTQIQPVNMDFRYGSYFGSAPPEAYERLICDCMSGDSTLFARIDEVMASWVLLTPVLEHWKKEKPNFPNYPSGTWGPQEADELLARDGQQWRLI